MKESPGDIEERVYPITVDYRMPLWTLVKQGEYGFVDHHISSFSFLSVEQEKTGVANVNVRLFSQKGGSVEQAGSSLDKERYRPADIHEFLAFGEQHPNVQYEFYISSPEALMKDDDSEDIYVLCLNCGGLGRDRRNLILQTITRDMSDVDWMLAAVAT